ncbi:MAG TPA: hypothetical protein VJA16_15850, partial [Thermoanaerobaculia bacterium]
MPLMLPMPLISPMPPMPPTPLRTPAEIFSLTRELVDVDSVTGRERQVGELLEQRLLELAES